MTMTRADEQARAAAIARYKASASYQLQHCMRLMMAMGAKYGAAAWHDDHALTMMQSASAYLDRAIYDIPGMAEFIAHAKQRSLAPGRRRHRAAAAEQPDELDEITLLAVGRGIRSALASLTPRQRATLYAILTR